MRRPGRWPLTNMCSSVWTSVGLASVAYILACFIPGSQAPLQLHGWDLDCLPSLPQPSISIITCKIGFKKCAWKLEKVAEAEGQGHEKHGMTNKLGIITGNEMHYCIAVGTNAPGADGWMDGRTNEAMVYRDFISHSFCVTSQQLMILYTFHRGCSLN